MKVGPTDKEKWDQLTKTSPKNMRIQINKVKLEANKLKFLR